MTIASRAGRGMLAVFAAVVWLCAAADAPPNSQPNPYRTAERWYRLPEGRTMGSSSAVAVAADGHIWVAERCGVNSCAGSNLPPVLEFDPSGNLVRSFGAGMFVFPHGMTLDEDGNMWVTDGQGGKAKASRFSNSAPKARC